MTPLDRQANTVYVVVVFTDPAFTGALPMSDPFDYRNIRPDIRQALDEWGTGERPYLGGFLLAVMANDLMQAVGRADADNLRALPAIVSYIRNELPGHCHGSYDICNGWTEKFIGAFE